MRSFAPEAVVRVLSQNASNLLTPVVMEAMANCPKFSCQREHFEDWVDKWERLLQMLTGNNNGCTLPDKYVTEILLQKLDGVLVMEILMKCKQDPNLSWRE